MDLGPRHFCHQNKKLLAIGSIIAISVSVIGLIFAEYWLHWTWTGFNKTLWDWMQLLIIPVALALGAFLLNRSDQRRGQAIALDNQREALLQSYLDRMSELLLEKNLRSPQPDNEVRNVARARTLTTLPRLDPGRKKSVLNFLNDTGLLFTIDMGYADLSGSSFCDLHSLDNFKLTYANFSDSNFQNVEGESVNLEHTNFSRSHLSHIKVPHANLQGANLSHAYLSYVDLRGSDLTSTDLREANLDHVIFRNANLSNADLRGANLSDTDLRDADLRGANLSNVDLRSTNLQGSSLSGANLSGTKFRKEDVCTEHLPMTVLQKEI